MDELREEIVFLESEILDDDDDAPVGTLVNVVDDQPEEPKAEPVEAAEEPVAEEPEQVEEPVAEEPAEEVVAESVDAETPNE